MLFIRMFIVGFLLTLSHLFAQSNPTDLIEYMVIDSLPHETLGTGLWYWGFGDVHLTTNGQQVMLAAKKTYKDAPTNQAQTHLVYSQRLGFGKWNFENIYNYMDSIYFTRLKAMLMHGVMPIVFFTDRVLYKSHNLYFVNQTGTGWVPTLLDLDPHNDSDLANDDIREHYDDMGFALSQGDDGVTAYWVRENNDEVSPGTWWTKWELVGKNWAAGETFVIWSSSYNQSMGLGPVVTKDGEYVAVSFHSADSNGHQYWGIRVFRKTDDGYTEDLADSTMEDIYGSFYPMAIGKKSNGDVLLIAKPNSSYLPSAIWLKSNGSWAKTVENYPTGSGLDSYLTQASGRDLANERIQFSSDGTAFWGDMDGWVTYTASAEISFYTPDGQFGHFCFPDLPGYQWHGSFQHHDFCITDDDTLHLVYNYQPAIDNAPIYLIEGKLYIPDLLAMLTDVKEPKTLNQPLNFRLFQNYPNPFNPVTHIRFFLAHREKVTLKVYDLLGRQVALLVNQWLNPGAHTVTFKAAHLTGGVYIYRLQAGDFVQQRKMILMK